MLFWLSAGIELCVEDGVAPNSGCTAPTNPLSVAESGSGASATVYVRLTSQPSSGSVQITASSEDDTIVTVDDGDSTTFTLSDPTTRVGVTVTGVDNSIDDSSGKRSTSITLAVGNSPAEYASVADTTLTVDVNNNDDTGM